MGPVVSFVNIGSDGNRKNEFTIFLIKIETEDMFYMDIICNKFYVLLIYKELNKEFCKQLVYSTWSLDLYPHKSPMINSHWLW